MSCIAAPHIGIPDVPGLSLLLGDITVQPPGVSAGLCCKIELQLPPVILPIGTILGLLAVGIGGGAAVDAILTTIDQVVSTVNELLDELTFDCPLD